jgi:hypothetical protein
MKEIRLLSGLVACTMAMAMAASLSAQTAEQGVAKVVDIKGSARYMTGANGNWQPLKNGTMLKSGAIVQTAAGSHVDIVLNNPGASGATFSMVSAPPSSHISASGPSYQPKVRQDAVRIFENTVLGIDKLSIDQTGVETITETKLDLKAGSIFGTVKKLSAGSSYEVKIPNGVAGIRGTVYYLHAAGLARVLSGSVVYAFMGTDGKPVTKTVTTGVEFDSRTGKESSILPGIVTDLERVSREISIPPTTLMSFPPDYTFAPVSTVQGKVVVPQP